MNRLQIIILLIVLTLITALLPGTVSAYLYTIKPQVPFRAGPGPRHKLLYKLDHNQSLNQLSGHGKWIKVQAPSGQTGYVNQDSVTDIWIKVHKKERTLFLMKNRSIIKSYPIALSLENPAGDKRKLGDYATPEGRFFICEMIKSPPPRYGSRSMRLSYPNIEDARRGLAAKLINYKTYVGIVKAIKAGKIPNQRTPLGGSIRIHGGKTDRYYTLGCVALSDADTADLFDQVRLGTRVEIYKSGGQDRTLNSPAYLSKSILKGAKTQLENPAFYSKKATAIIKLKYPMGDIPTGHAVCTDIIIRALRKAGIDLQALIHEDVLTHPKRYKRWIKDPNFHIDHRRTRNLQIFFQYYTQALALKSNPSPTKIFKPGQIVTLDTGIPNGTPYDHIGIIDSEIDHRGFPQVINIWDTGWRTMSMGLLGSNRIGVKGNFRFNHPFDYQ